MTRKACTRCGVEKPLEEFPKRSEVPDGRASQCKACEKARKAGFYVENRDAIIERTTAYHKANREVGRRAVRKWRETNPEKSRAATRQSVAKFRAKDPEGYRAYQREWARKNPEKAKAKRDRFYAKNGYVYLRPYNQRYKTTKLAAFVEDVHDDVVLLRDLGVCGLCDKPVMGPIDIDHILPLSRGGEHSYANTQLAHHSCNRSKGARG